jgi:hypothetical protein
MNTLASRLIGTAGLFVLVFLTGFWLSHASRPLNTISLTIHKLIALAALGLIGFTVYQANQTTPLNSTAMISAVITGVLFVVTIIAGGLLSLDKPVTALTMVHKVGPFLIVASAAVTLYLAVNQPA